MTITRPKRTVAIIGTGFSGIGTFIQLEKELGITPTLFELNSDIGGTWLQNTYPGCSGDVPCQLYSLSSELNPNWSQNFGSQSEILEYLRSICKKHKIYQNTRFETRVIQATWVNNQWELIIENKQNKETVYFDILFSGIGALRIPRIPDEFKKFEGPVIHTGEWDSSIDYKGKRIALVGSGSSATQIAPYLSNEASQLILFQRSPAWIFPKVQKNVSENIKFLFIWFPFLMTLYRWFLILFFERQYSLLGYPDSKFAKNTSQAILNGNNNYLINSGHSDLCEKLRPTSVIGCRRIVQSSDFYQTVIKDNVSVVNDPIENINGTIITTQEGSQYEVDIVVLGTGFETQEGVLGDLKIIGKDGQSLTELWNSNAPQLFKSTMIHGFPNFFMLLGPYTLTGYISVVLMAEIQIKYAVRCIKKIPTRIEPKEEAQEKYMAKLRSDFQDTVWTLSCSSWYKNKSGAITSLYPNTSTRFRWELGQFNKHDYE